MIAGAAFAFTGTAQAAAVGAVYTKSSSWTGGYTGQYVITNNTAQAQADWTLRFDLPAGTRIDSLWNGTHTVDGQHVTVKPASWNKQLAAGASVTVGFVASGTGAPGNPTACLINGVKCSVEQGATPPPGDVPPPPRRRARVRPPPSPRRPPPGPRRPRQPPRPPLPRR